MKSVLEKLWFDYISDESNKISEEEKAIVEKLNSFHDILVEKLDKKQCEELEEYIDLTCELDSLYTKSAFIKGCKFTASFLIEVICKP